MALTHSYEPAGTGHSALDGSALGDALDGVPLVDWPAESARREQLAREGRARLLVVADGTDPPAVWDPLEDWVRAGVDTVEAYVRRERLRRRHAARAPAVLDDDGLVRRGSRWVALSPRERCLASTLLARPGTLVGRAALLAAVCPDVDVRAEVEGDRRRLLDTLVRRVRLRIAPLGMTIHTVRGQGFVLEMGDLPV
jgi:Transcriptional regulatory protein, C terminal